MLTSKKNRIFYLGMMFLILCACSLFQSIMSNESPGVVETVEQLVTSDDTLAESSALMVTESVPNAPATPDIIQTTILPSSQGLYQTPQIGLNFIRFFWSEKRGGPLNMTTPYYQPDWIFDDFSAMGIQAYRQFVRSDLLWNIVEPANDQWDFKAADAVLFSGESIEPIVTLFALQYASPTPPWVEDPVQFQKTIGPDAEDYLKTVVQRYASVVRYWEIGNEMNHWRAADPNASAQGPGRLPHVSPLDGFSPREQGVFLAQAAALIHQYDPDAIVVMPGMGGLDEYSLNLWLPGVIEGSGVEWFDVTNYHFYIDWERYGGLRNRLQETVERLGIADKPIWLTETGVTANPKNTVRTDYPNSPEAQAADVFRRIVQAYGHGDTLVMWHTYISSPVTEDNSWGLYGVRTDKAEKLLSYYALKLFISELIPFDRVELLSSDPHGLNNYRITTSAGKLRYVIWGKGSFQMPNGMTEYTSVIPDSSGEFTWLTAQPGASISEVPILLH